MKLTAHLHIELRLITVSDTSIPHMFSLCAASLIKHRENFTFKYTLEITP
jgi:hypothetical protein